MRLHPAVPVEEIREWLRAQALERWGQVTPELEQTLGTLAQAMADVSTFELPEEVEPQLL